MRRSPPWWPWPRSETWLWSPPLLCSGPAPRRRFLRPLMRSRSTSQYSRRDQHGVRVAPGGPDGADGSRRRPDPTSSGARSCRRTRWCRPRRRSGDPPWWPAAPPVPPADLSVRVSSPDEGRVSWPSCPVPPSQPSSQPCARPARSAERGRRTRLMPQRRERRAPRRAPGSWCSARRKRTRKRTGRRAWRHPTPHRCPGRRTPPVPWPRHRPGGWRSWVRWRGAPAARSLRRRAAQDASPCGR